MATLMHQWCVNTIVDRLVSIVSQIGLELAACQWQAWFAGWRHSRSLRGCALPTPRWCRHACGRHARLFCPKRKDAPTSTQTRDCGTV